MRTQSCRNVNTDTQTSRHVIVSMMTAWPGNASCIIGFRVVNTQVDSPHKGPAMPGFAIIVVVSLIELFDKQSSYRWFETLSCSCDGFVIVKNCKRATVLKYPPTWKQWVGLWSSLLIALKCTPHLLPVLLKGSYEMHFLVISEENTSWQSQNHLREVQLVFGYVLYLTNSST